MRFVTRDGYVFEVSGDMVAEFQAIHECLEDGVLHAAEDIPLPLLDCQGFANVLRILNVAIARGSEKAFVRAAFSFLDGFSLEHQKALGHAARYLGAWHLHSIWEMFLCEMETWSSTIKQASRWDLMQRFSKASAWVRSSKRIVLAAVNREPFILRAASKSVCDDREVVLAAVRVNGLALQFASDTLRCDPQICGAAIKQEPHALQYVQNAYLLAKLSKQPSARQPSRSVSRTRSHRAKTTATPVAEARAAVQRRKKHAAKAKLQELRLANAEHRMCSWANRTR